MTRNHSNKTLPPGSHWILILISVGVFGSLILFAMNQLENRKFDAAVQAYESGQCEQAIAKLSDFIGDRQPRDDVSDRVAKAIVYRQECQVYQSILAAANQPSQMLGMAGQFTEKYPNSSLSFRLGESLALNLIRNQTQSWGGTLACQKLESLENMAGLSEFRNMIPKLYQDCGELFVSQRQQDRAIVLYERFLDKFPEHPAKAEVKKAYAAALVKDAKTKGSGKIPSPGQSGVTKDGSTQVSIQNDSPEPMRIVLSGPTPKVEELPPCKECQSYTTANLPSSCPKKGPMDTYILNPGNYEVLVKSNGARYVRPFTGNWRLNAGKAYRNCFYVISQSSP